MNLIDEIKEAEEKALKLKKDAQQKGQFLVENERNEGENRLLALENKKAELIKEELTRIKKVIEEKIKKLQEKEQETTQKIQTSYKNNREKVIKEIQEIILKWPSSR